jgi:kynurenine formamidase
MTSRDEILGLITSRRNWGRWGTDDERGAINLITAEKRLEAARLVQRGHVVSLARPFPVEPAGNNRKPAMHYMERRSRPGDAAAGVAADFIGIAAHGVSSTHLDALCHVWDKDGMWNGRQADEHITIPRASWGGIHHWKDGIITRGVLLDVPRFRGEPYVTEDKPVTGEELRAIAEDQGVDVRSGDALVVHSGREAWDRVEPAYGSGGGALQGSPSGREGRPGLHASCLEPLRDWDVAMLVWDMLDATPNEYELPFTVHAAIFAFGMALLDNALVEPLAEACMTYGNYEFMLTVAPLWIEGGTASPVNPLALL